MSYSNNPHAPKARRLAVNLVVRDGLSVAEAARRSGVHRTTLHRWIRKTRDLDLHWKAHIPTLSSVPPHRSNELPPEIVAAIVAERKRSGRGAYFVHLDLLDANVKMSLSSVKRTLRRQGLTKTQSKWKRYRPFVERPLPIEPGALVQIDAIHFVQPDGTRFYVVTMIDLYSRAPMPNTHRSSTNERHSPSPCADRTTLALPYKCSKQTMVESLASGFMTCSKAKASPCVTAESAKATTTLTSNGLTAPSKKNASHPTSERQPFHTRFTGT